MKATLIAIGVGLFAADSVAAESLFLDQTQRLGIDFVHFNGMSGETYFPEMMGAGAAFLDYDRDGDLDVYLVQGTMLGPDKAIGDASFKPAHPLPLSDRLYRNRLVEDGSLAFEDVTSETGVDQATGYGMGVSVGDVNGDGYPDLYLANLGSNQLLLNDGKGRFEDRTDKLGVDDPRWSVTAVFFDYDGDGRQDLYVVNYVDFSFENRKLCRSFNDQPDYCSPQSYNPATDRLLRNLGDGRFEDASVRSTIAARRGHGLGAVTADFNGDHLPDLYVANDGSSNFLWINQGNGRFKDEALMSGVAVNMTGTPEASMGVDVADFDEDGDLDLFMTHLDRQTNTLYVNDGKGWFMDRTGATVLGSSSFAFTGFGTLWFDYDNDGWLDLLSANGAVTKIETQLNSGEILPLKQRNQLWRNTGKGDYVDVSDRAGDGFTTARVSRGAAFGDVDNDGDLDVLITNNAAAPNLLINQEGQKRSWIGIEPVEGDGDRLLVGTQVHVKTDSRELWRRSRTDGSYVASHDPRVLVGLGEHEGPVSVELVWADGSRRTVTLEPNRYHRVRKKAESE